DAGSLFNALLSSDHRQWLAFMAAHSEYLKAPGIDVQKTSDWMRLPTVAFIAADSLGQGERLKKWNASPVISNAKLIAQ
ncbi:hypothetical protein GGI24_002586, partial [Coemansia furcata]